MRPSSFDYHRAESLEMAVELLAELGDEARPISGGQSLVPMMNLRLATPSHLIDINALPFDKIERRDGSIHIGGLVRHSQVLEAPAIAEHLPLLKEAVSHIAHPTIRNHGTFGGSLAHADPTAELGLMALLYDAKIDAKSREGARRIEASAFFQGAFATALDPAEIIVEIEVPIPPAKTYGSFRELSERHGDFAIAAVGVRIETKGDEITAARVVSAGASLAPRRVQDVEEFLIGQSIASPDRNQAAVRAAALHEPFDDLRASAEYRKNLVGELTSRAVHDACMRAMEAL